MTDQNTPLPTARMATVNSTPFWIYWIGCLFLYSYNHFSTSPDIAAGIINPVGGYIIICIFLTLFLYLAGPAIKNEGTFKLFNVFCYVFEAATILFLIYKVFF